MRIDEISRMEEPTGTMSYGKYGTELPMNDTTHSYSIPDDMYEKFYALANQQRGNAEHKMLEIQKKYKTGNMWFGAMLEHLGDLIHRSADAVRFNGVITGSFDSKVKEGLITLGPNLKGNMADFKESIKADAKDYGVSEKELMDMLKGDLNDYIAYHYELPSYNRIHQLCKKITTSLGAFELEETYSHLQKMQSLIDKGNAEFQRMNCTVTRDNNGKIVQLD